MKVCTLSSPARAGFIPSTARGFCIVVGFIPTGVYLMPTIEKLSVALPSEMAALVRRAVEQGEYSSNSEVIRDALRDWTHKRNLRQQGLAGLRKKWLDAVADESDGLDPDSVFDDLEGRYEKLAQSAAK
jgi:antitoxin ParD1/3/4